MADIPGILNHSRAFVTWVRLNMAFCLRGENMNNEAGPNKVLEQYGKEKVAGFISIRDQLNQFMRSQESRNADTSTTALVSAMVEKGVPQDAAEVLVGFIR
jgi:hypothetical protein